MDDKTLLSRINELVAEEERLLESSRGTEGLNVTEDARLKAVEVALDQCWDLLRQRRAKRHAGQEQLTLRALPGIEQHALGVPPQEVAVVVAVAGGGLAGRPQHDELAGRHGRYLAPSE